MRSLLGGVGVQCGRVKVVYFTPQLYGGSQSRVVGPYPSGIVYLGHLYNGESGHFRPLIFLGVGAVRCGVSSDR